MTFRVAEGSRDAEQGQVIGLGRLADSLMRSSGQIPHFLFIFLTVYLAAGIPLLWDALGGYRD